MLDPITIAALHCLAKNIYHEARGEPIEGQFGVALVTLHRANRKLENVCKVVHAPKQFSWTNKKPYPPILEKEAWRNAQAVARLSLHMRDFTNGADHFHRIDIAPSWAINMEIKGQWGDHVFYRSTQKWK